MFHAGIDVGSTGTKLIALDEKRDILFQKVVPTGWSCVETAESLWRELTNTLHISREDARIVATGYGRVSVPFADKTVTEISCHGKGAAYLFGDEAFTVVDIGGQDTKVIEIEHGIVKNFAMNDKCSAGTGRFLDVMSGTMGVTLSELCALAQHSENHVSISSMCTVFAESEVVSLIGRGTKKEDIAYGILASIADKVKSQVGKAGSVSKVALTGGLCDLPFILSLLSEKLGTDVVTHPLARYAGAIGAALYAEKLN